MALYKNKKMNDLVARKPFKKGNKYQINDLLPNRPKGLKGEALRRYIQKKKQQGKKDIISMPNRPGKPIGRPFQPKPMPKPPVGRPVRPIEKPKPGRPKQPSGRPISGMPGMTYRGGKKQRERVLAKLKQMRENA